MRKLTTAAMPFALALTLGSVLIFAKMITAGAAPNQRQIARANQLTMLVVHGNEHYGNLVTTCG